MIEGINAISFIGAAGFGATVASAVFSYLSMKRLNKSRKTLAWMIKQSLSSIEAADRVLASPLTPKELRIPLLLMLKGVSSPGTAKWINHILSKKDERPMDPELTKTLAKFRLDAPELASDLEEAIFGLTSIAIPLNEDGKSAYKAPEIKVTSPAKAIVKMSNFAHDLELSHMPA